MKRDKADNSKLNSVNFSACNFCQKLVAFNKDNECKLCSKFFCLKHKAEINHKCEKLSKDTERYLNAKNQFKSRLRDVKNKVR